MPDLSKEELLALLKLGAIKTEEYWLRENARRVVQRFLDLDLISVEPGNRQESQDPLLAAPEMEPRYLPAKQVRPLGKRVFRQH
jgi:7,8-dihydro-6-hydroxymethylpterin-pyrophosphokinase